MGAEHISHRGQTLSGLLDQGLGDVVGSSSGVSERRRDLRPLRSRLHHQGGQLLVSDLQGALNVDHRLTRGRLDGDQHLIDEENLLRSVDPTLLGDPVGHVLERVPGSGDRLRRALERPIVSPDLAVDPVSHFGGREAGPGQEGGCALDALRQDVDQPRGDVGGPIATGCQGVDRFLSAAAQSGSRQRRGCLGGASARSGQRRDEVGRPIPQRSQNLGHLQRARTELDRKVVRDIRHGPTGRPDDRAGDQGVLMHREADVQRHTETPGEPAGSPRVPDLSESPIEVRVLAPELDLTQHRPDAVGAVGFVGGAWEPGRREVLEARPQPDA